MDRPHHEAVEGTFIGDSGEPTACFNRRPDQPKNACDSLGEDYGPPSSTCAFRWNKPPSAGCSGVENKRGIVEIETTLLAPATAPVGTDVDNGRFRDGAGRGRRSGRRRRDVAFRLYGDDD